LSEDADFKIRLDMTEAKSEMARVQKQADAVTQDWANKESTIKRGMRSIEMAMHASVGLVRNILGAIGITLTPVQNAIVQTIMTVVDSLYRVAVAYATTGYGLLLTATVSMAAIGLSISGTMEVMRGMNEAKAQIDHALGAIDNLYSLFNTLKRA